MQGDHFQSRRDWLEPSSSYTASSPLASLDHQESYLTGFFNFIGVSDITFVRVEGVNMGSEQRQRSLSTALAEIATLRVA